MSVQVKTRILLTDPSLLIHPDLAPQVEALMKAGHSVEVNEDLKAYDFIAGPNCWLLRPEVAGLFAVAVKQAKKVANADEARKAQQQSAKETTKRKPRATGKAGSRSAKVKTTDTERSDTVDQTTFLETDPGGTT